MPISWQIPNATKIFQAARIKGVPIADVAKGSRPHQVVPRDGPRAAARPRRGVRQAAQGPVRRLLLNRAAGHAAMSPIMPRGSDRSDPDAPERDACR